MVISRTNIVIQLHSIDPRDGSPSAARRPPSLTTPRRSSASSRPGRPRLAYSAFSGPRGQRQGTEVRLRDLATGEETAPVRTGGRLPSANPHLSADGDSSRGGRDDRPDDDVRRPDRRLHRPRGLPGVQRPRLLLRLALRPGPDRVDAGAQGPSGREGDAAARARGGHPDGGGPLLGRPVAGRGAGPGRRVGRARGLPGGRESGRAGGAE